MARTQAQGVVRKPATRTSVARPRQRVWRCRRRKGTSRANTWSVRSESGLWSNSCTVLDITEMLTSAVVIGVVRSTRRGALKAATAEVQSTLSASSAEARTP